MSSGHEMQPERGKAPADGNRSWWLAAAGPLLRRPRLWPAALGQLRALAPPGWWRHFPPAPSPSARWLAFRMETAYGDEHARPAPEDVLAFLEWCRETRLRARHMH